MPENAKLYECKKCNFKCSKKSNWDNHILTLKHTMEAKKWHENAEIYNCIKCNFKCSKKSNWYKHLLTLKHNMEAKMPENAESYECIKCNFKCSKKSNWDKHILTRKHISDAKKMPENADEYQCEICSKIYRSRGSLWKHKRICVNKPTTATTNNMYWLNNENAMTAVLQVIKQNQELITSNSHFKELLIGQQYENQKLQSQLIEAVKDNGNTINNTVNNTTNNNQKFNLNFFLNTTCKDAMNMSEFIENMEVNFKDIENIGKNGYVSGMTDMILSRIKELDVTKRPMHCTDLKRETMYIKDNNEWTKDTPENTKLHKMINYVAKQNYAKMPLWRQRNPECLDSDHPKYDFCIKMMRNMLGDVGTEQVRLDNKVIKNLSKHIFVDKGVN